MYVFKTINTLFLLVGTTIVLLLVSVSLSSHTQIWTSWSGWVQSECYEGIWTRHRSKPSSIQGKQRVQVEVMNTYRRDISINTRLTNDPNERTAYRIDIPAGRTYSGGTTEAFLLTGHRFYFLHEQVRFEGNKYEDGYRKCDNTNYIY